MVSLHRYNASSQTDLYVVHCNFEQLLRSLRAELLFGKGEVKLQDMQCHGEQLMYWGLGSDQDGALLDQRTTTLLRLLIEHEFQFP